MDIMATLLLAMVMVLAMAGMAMESVLLMLNLFMDIMATLLLVMVMVLAMADMVMESVLLILFMDSMATLLLAMAMVLAMADMAMESVQLMLTLFRDIIYSPFLALAMDMDKKIISHLFYPMSIQDWSFVPIL